MPRRRAVYPGTFDPVTNGHLDIISRACPYFDEVVVALHEKSSKPTLFSLPERLRLLHASLRTRKSACAVRVATFSGLVVDFARSVGARTLVRGLRATSDFEYEFQMALMNRYQAREIETLFLMPDERHVYLSSSMVREVARLRGNLKDFVPPPVLKALQARHR